MKPLKVELTGLVSKVFNDCGYDSKFGQVVVSNRPDLCQFQCNGALSAAKVYKTNPMQIAEKVCESIKELKVFSRVEIAKPGFINLTLDDDYLANYIQQVSEDKRFGCPEAIEPLKIIIDYGGPNVAKPLHVGHLRSAIIGESIKRISSFIGHKVMGDIHLGDWGLQMGMIISEFMRRQPESDYFDESYTGSYPVEEPFTLEDLEKMYPAASKLAKEDENAMEQARICTYELQNGRVGYVALWKHIMNVSLRDLKKNYEKLNVNFDLWLGESDANTIIPEMMEMINKGNFVYESEGAYVIDISEPDDKVEMPPFMVYKSDGAVLYSTTDLATIMQRIRDYNPDIISYVVDNRQGTHFKQLFRCAYKTGIASKSLLLEHNGFGTMNGTDGKPYKTRDGGVMRLSDLIKLVEEKASEKLQQANIEGSIDEDEKKKIIHDVGLAALKFADLSNYRGKDYIFDLDKFSSFEGKTGPYLLYTTVRIKSILRKAGELGYKYGSILPAKSDVERDLMLKITEFPNQVEGAFADRAPNQICEYVFELATVYNRFYHEHKILKEEDEVLKGSRLQLSKTVKEIMELTLFLLGISVPERM